MLYSGADGCHMEEAGQFVLCSSVDHHPGCSSWITVTLPAHISPIQGKWNTHLQQTSRVRGVKVVSCTSVVFEMTTDIEELDILYYTYPVTFRFICM